MKLIYIIGDMTIQPLYIVRIHMHMFILMCVWECVFAITLEAEVQTFPIGTSGTAVEWRY